MCCSWCKQDFIILLYYKIRLGGKHKRNSAFISAVNKALKTKYFTHSFHFIDNSNIEKELLWKEDIYLNCAGKNLLMSTFLRDIDIIFEKLKRS